MDFGGNNIPLNTIIYKNEYTCVFLNHRPILPFHLLICPIRRTESINELTQEEIIDLYSTMRKMIDTIKPICNGHFIFLQDGKVAGQTVAHVHMHVVPRHNNDSRKLIFSSSKRKQMCDEEHLKNVETIKEMLYNCEMKNYQ